VKRRFSTAEPLSEEYRRTLGSTGQMDRLPALLCGSRGEPVLGAISFSRGLVEPVDDFRSTTRHECGTASSLGQDFRDMATHPLPDQDHGETLVPTSFPACRMRPTRDDLINYSHALPRPLDAEVLIDAISYGTGVPEEFEQNREKTWRSRHGTRASTSCMPDVFRSRC